MKFKVFLSKLTVFRAFHSNLLFYDGLLTVFLLLGDRGRPSDLDICTVNQYLSIFAKIFHRFQKARKIWVKNISQSEMECCLLKSTGFRASHRNLLFHDGLLTVFPFVRRPWKTVRLGYLYSKSISKHFRKIFHRFQKARKVWVTNISQSEIKSFFAKIHGLPGFPLKSFFS